MLPRRLCWTVAGLAMVMYNSVPVSGGMVRLSVQHLSAQTGKRMEYVKNLKHNIIIWTHISAISWWYDSSIRRKAFNLSVSHLHLSAQTGKRMEINSKILIYSRSKSSLHDKLHELYPHFPPIAQRTLLIIKSSSWKRTVASRHPVLIGRRGMFRTSLVRFLWQSEIYMITKRKKMLMC